MPSGGSTRAAMAFRQELAGGRSARGFIAAVFQYQSGRSGPAAAASPAPWSMRSRRMLAPVVRAVGELRVAVCAAEALHQRGPGSELGEQDRGGDVHARLDRLRTAQQHVLGADENRRAFRLVQPAIGVYAAHAPDHTGQGSYARRLSDPVSRLVRRETQCSRAEAYRSPSLDLVARGAGEESRAGHAALLRLLVDGA